MPCKQALRPFAEFLTYAAGSASGVTLMSSEEKNNGPASDVAELIRAARSRVPLDAAELLAQEPPETIEAVLRGLPQDLALRIAFELPEALRPQGETGEVNIPVPGQVSELTDPVHGVLHSGTTVQAAIEYLRAAESVSDITYLWVVDDQHKLLGLVVMRDLLIAQLSQRVDDIMIRRPYALRPEMEIGDAIKAAVRRQYPVYPVCDPDGRLVGTVRGWKLAERQAIEISAQSGQMVGISKEERVTTSVWDAFKMRHP